MNVCLPVYHACCKGVGEAADVLEEVIRVVKKLNEHLLILEILIRHLCGRFSSQPSSHEEEREAMRT